MKKYLSLLAVVVLSLITVIVFASGSEDQKFSTNVLYTSVKDADAKDATTTTKDAAASKTTVKTQAKKSKVKAPTISPKAEVKTPKVTPVKGVSKTEASKIALSDIEDTVKPVEPVNCDLPNLNGEEAKYDAQVITVRKKFKFDLGEEFRVKVYVKNAGNMPWFSRDSGCPGMKIYLGTTRDDERNSQFYLKDLAKENNGWVSESKVTLDSDIKRVDPGEVASFTFYGKAAGTDSIYREYFAPVLSDGTYLRNAEFKVDVFSGDTDDTSSDIRTKLYYAYKSIRVDDLQIDGGREIDIDLSEQKLYLKLGGYVVKEFRVSSGKSATPTPTGNYKILLKQDVRVGSEPPHYVMPKFQMFTSGGAGLHALPSLANDGGTFWTEAKEHIGRPVSHGCVRMLPEDAEFTYKFTEVGDPVNIHW